MRHCPSTRADRRKISRASTGFTRAYGTLRPATIGTPNRLTVSDAITAAWREDQCGSAYVRLITCAPTSSTWAALTGPTVRAHSRVVSTISPAITSGGWVLASDEPGLIANRVPRAPMYSRRGARPRGLRCPLAGSSLMSASPTWDSRPVRMAVCTRSIGAAAELRCSFRSRAMSRSWACRSCHSRIRRKCRYSWRHIRRKALPDRALCWLRR